MVTVVHPSPRPSRCSEPALVDRIVSDDRQSDSVVTGLPHRHVSCLIIFPRRVVCLSPSFRALIKEEKSLALEVISSGWPSNPSMSQCFPATPQPGPPAFCPGQLAPWVPWFLGLGLSWGAQGRSTLRAAEDTVLFRSLYAVLHFPPKHLCWESSWVTEVVCRLTFPKTLSALGWCFVHLISVVSRDFQLASAFVMTGPCCSPGWTGRCVSPVWRRTGNNGFVCGCHLQAYGPCGDGAVH